MSQISEEDLDQNLLKAVAITMREPETAEEQVERKLDWIIRELDELCGIANNPETVDLVEGQRVAVGQIVTRAQLIAGFLMARQPRPTLVRRVS